MFGRKSAEPEEQKSKGSDLATYWQTAPLEEAVARLADLRRDAELGAQIIQRRLNEERREEIRCAQCKREIADGKWAYLNTPLNLETGMHEKIYYCSSRCFLLAKQPLTAARYERQEREARDEQESRRRA